MKRKEQVAAGMLRNPMADSLRRSVAAVADRLRTAADRVAELEGDVDRIGLPPAVEGQHPASPGGIVAQVLLILRSNAPDLDTLAQSAEEYNRRVRPLPGVEKAPGCEVVTMGAACTTEPLPGLRVCFGHLWQAARSRGIGNVFPVGSPEPKEASVPAGTLLVGENGVQWVRSGWGDWTAVGPAGDGRNYHWSRINGSTQDGQELALLLPEVVR